MTVVIVVALTQTPGGDDGVIICMVTLQRTEQKPLLFKPHFVLYYNELNILKVEFYEHDATVNLKKN